MKHPSPLCVTIPLAWSGRTIKSILYNHFNLSRGQITALKKHQGIYLDQKPVFVTHPVTAGQILTLHITPAEQSFPPERIPLAVAYEDQDLIVVNKPPGLLIHPVRFHSTGTLANALAYHWQKHDEKASFHPIHRLDKTTSGLVLIAKNPWCHQQLSRQIKAKKISRLYLAACYGFLPQSSGTITLPIKRSTTGVKREVSVDGKPSLTRFRRIKNYPSFSLLAIKLCTGRTHQIRVHLCAIGHPLYGDFLYGEPDPLFTRPALHAARIGFTHPRSHKRIKISAPPPPDFSTLLREKPARVPAREKERI